MEPSSDLAVTKLDEELPLYVGAPEPPTKPERPEPVPSAPPPLAVPAPIAFTTGRLLPTYSRLIDLPGDELSGVLDEWWHSAAAGETATIRPGLRVTRPSVERSMWTFRGRLRRGIGRRSVPITLDLWGYNGAYTRVMMVPRARVATTRRYFRIGNRSLDRLVVELTQARRRMARAGAAAST